MPGPTGRLSTMPGSCFAPHGSPHTTPPLRPPPGTQEQAPHESGLRDHHLPRATAVPSKCVTEEPILSSDGEALRGLVTGLRQHSLQAGPSGLRPQPRSLLLPQGLARVCRLLWGPSLPPSPRPRLSSPDQAWAGLGPCSAPNHPCKRSRTQTLSFPPGTGDWAIARCLLF